MSLSEKTVLAAPVHQLALPFNRQFEVYRCTPFKDTTKYHIAVYISHDPIEATYLIAKTHNVVNPTMNHPMIHLWG